MASKASEITRFIELFVIFIGIILQAIQNFNGGVKETQVATPNQTSRATLGLWDYCVSDKLGVNVLNYDVNISIHFPMGELCLPIQKYVDNMSKHQLIPNPVLIVAARWLLVVTLPLLYLILHVLVTVANPSKRTSKVMLLQQVVAVVLESVILGLMIGMYNSLDANFNLGWPWIMAIVALSFLVLGKILFIVLWCLAPEYLHLLPFSGRGESEHRRKMNVCLRTMVIIWCIIGLCFQLVVHLDYGVKFEVNKGHNVYFGLWWYCFETPSVTEVQMGQGLTFHNIFIKNFCLELRENTQELVNFNPLMIARVTFIMSHLMTFSAIFFAIFAKFCTSRTRKALSFARLVFVLFAFFFLLVGCSVVATLSPVREYSLQFAFYLPWVGLVALFIASVMCIVQACYRQELFGEDDYREMYESY